MLPIGAPSRSACSTLPLRLNCLSTPSASRLPCSSCSRVGGEIAIALASVCCEICPSSCVICTVAGEGGGAADPPTTRPSFDAPIFSGMVAIINQKLNSTGQGVINSTLYSLAADSSTYASAFHDITSGGNECAAGSSY